MPRQRYTTEQIINKLRQAEVLLSQGRSIREVAKELAISDHTYYRWRREYGRYGYRRGTALLRSEGWRVNHKRVERIWRQAGWESAAEAPEEATIMAERYSEHSPEASSEEPCMEL